MTHKEARKRTVFAPSQEEFEKGIQAVVETEDANLAAEIYVDIQSRLAAWTLNRTVDRRQIGGAVAKLGRMLTADAKATADAEAASIKNSMTVKACEAADAGKLGFFWGHDLCTGYDWSLRRGACFVTTNPAKINVFRKDFPEEWGALLDQVHAEYPGITPEETVSRMYIKVVASIAEQLRPIYDASSGKYGFACIQPNPTKLEDSRAMIDEVSFFEREFKKLFRTDRPNIVYKLPAVPAAHAAVQELHKQGLRICMTLNFSAYQHNAFAGEINGGARGDFLVLMGGIVDDFVKKDLIAEGFTEEAAAELSHSAATAVLNHSYANLKEKGVSPIIMSGSTRGAWSISSVLCGDARQPVCLTSMANMMAVFDSEPRKIRDVISQPFPGDTLAKLAKSANFRAAYEIDGLNDANILQYPPLLYVNKSFVDAYEQTLASVK